MKKFVFILAAGSMALAACNELSKVAGDLGKQVGTLPGQPLTSTEIVNGLKAALQQGTDKSTGSASQVNGFLNNPLIRIPFPPSVQKVKDNVMKVPGGPKWISDFEETMNHAAEEASKEAAPIFINAITSMTITDGLNILRGTDTAATNYLRTKTTNDLTTKFRPVVNRATQKVQLTKYWTPVINAYNKIPFMQPVNPDLDGYITSQAIGGLFKLIGNEEKNIRTNPAARASEILKKVFGSTENPHNK